MNDKQNGNGGRAEEPILIKGRTLSRRSFLSLMAAAGAAAAGTAMLGGCSSPSGEGSAEPVPESASDRPETVTDAKGREVAVPERIERIGTTAMGGATQTICCFGGADRLVFGPDMQKSASMLLKMFPQIADVPNAGTFDDINIETIAAAEPDFVLVSSTSDKGNAQIEDLGVPTYVMPTANASVDNLRKDYLNISILLGNMELGEKYVEYWDSIMDYVAETSASIEEGKKLRVYRCGEAITKVNHTPWACNWITAAGGIPVAEAGTTGDASLEQVALWDPDVISTSADVETILEDPSLQEFKAVKNKMVYKSPQGAMGWDAPSPEVPLGFAWLAQTLYPDVFADIDLEEKTKELYREFYGYDLSDEEYEEFFA